ncbi:Ig-like domain-containing protein [Telluria aromaticivorans]|uniref:DUF4214 domain-containing protein n=1 Tax=Telluria aromaticivorans TaxID=2725995 RepID=A0A7Y2K224_9BURK|nr:Ig-like domain-containing protein [Telluria aromaticivorans]NNG25185.1 DUF4214 domain-containing protein [Telluria aromaticivorans]
MASNSSTMASIPSVTISFENFGDFANDGDENDTAQNAVYRVNGDPAYQLVIDGAITGTVAYDGYDAVFAASNVLEDAVTLSFATGQVFTPGAIVLSNYATSLVDQSVVITGYNASSQQVGAAVTHTLANNYYGALASESIALPGMTGITRLVITATTLGGKIEYLMIDGISMTNIQPPAAAVVSVSSSTANGSYNAGDLITLTVSFDREVDVDTTGGLPTLQLETGSTDRTASYAGGSGTATLSFSYTVQAGDTSADLNYTSTGALALNGATIMAAGNGANADLVLPVPGAAGSLGANKAIVLDTAAPLLAITSDKAALKVGDTAAITFTFSENPGVSFNAADVTVSGGALGALSGSGLVRTATFTPTPATNGGSAGISVAGGSYTDAAGNSGEAGASPAISFDTLAPTVSITSDKAALKAGQTAAITFTFSEDPGASFTLGDVAVSGGSLGPLGGSGTTRTATFTPAAATNNGTASITVAAGAYLDAGGNAGGAGATPALAFDTQAPGAPAAPDLAAASDTGSSSTDNLTKDTALTLRGVAGSAEAGATIRLYHGATLIATTAAAGDGRWAADSIFLADGAHTITATATDAAGNTSAASGGLTVTIDRTAPAAPGIPDLAMGSDSGSSSSDNITSVNTPTVGGAAGSAAGGATVILYDSNGSTVIGSTTAAGDGSWSVVTSVLSEGVHTITAKALDAAGNLGAASGALALAIDRTGPATSAAGAAFSADSGASNSDLVTAIAAQTISGTLDASLGAGERVEVSTNNGASWQPATAAEGGTTWSLATTLLASDTLRVRVVDAAGNAGTAFACAYVFDTAAPVAPSTPDLASASDTGLSAGDDITGDTTPTFTGNAESGALVTLYDGATVIGSAVATGGAWSITSSALAQGSHSITATARDAAGNEGAASSALDVFVETGAPATAAASVVLSADTGASGSDLVTRTAAQTISGTLDANLAAGERVEVSFDGGGSWTTASATVGASTWSLSATLAAGVHTLQVRVANAVDNAGPVLQRAVTLDTAAPAVTITSSAAQLKAGESATITFSFSDDPGSSFSWDGSTGDVTVSGGTLGPISGTGLTRSALFTPSSATNGGSAAITIGAGAYADLAGNLGAAGATPALVFDTLAPAAPSIPVLAPASDSGPSSSDGVTNDATPTFTGTAEHGATVTLYDSGGAAIGSGLASMLDGAWSITVAALGPGAHTIAARAADAAGNTGAAGSGLAVTVDTAAPTLAITTSAPMLRIGQTASITFTFSEDPGAGFDAAAVAVGGGTLGALTGTGLTRSAIYTPDAGIDGGTASISVAAASYADLAGNSGGAGTLAALAFDTLAPGAPAAPGLALASDTGTAGDGITGTASPRIEGTAAANAHVALYAGAAMAGSATADALGHWSIATALGFGTHTLTATQSDAAGNVSAASAAFTLRIDAPPAAPDPLVDGVPVRQQPVLLPGGVLGTAVVVPIVTATRTESSGRADVADIPLATNGGTTVLLAQLSPGFGLRASGASLPAAGALEFLVNSIKAATPFHAPAEQGYLTGNGLTFLAGLAPAESLLVQTVAPVSTAAPGGVLTLAGAPAAPGRSVALVIDTTGLASGGTIELRDVDFAAVVGNADILARGNPVLVGDGANQRFAVEAGSTATVFAGGGADTLGFGIPDGAATSQQGAQAPPASGAATLHGGKGIDAASFLGGRGDYDIAWHNGYVVVGSKSNPAASAMLVNVEMLRFADGSVAMGNVENIPALETLAGMYQSVLGRQADLGGFAYWADAVDAGASWGAVALRMVDSSEYSAAAGGFNGQATHDIALLYAALFNRAVDAAGLAYWQEAMQQGVTLEQVAIDLLQSVEMVGHRRAVLDWDFSL